MAEFSTFRKRAFTALGIAAGIVLALILLIAALRDDVPPEALSDVPAVLPPVAAEAPAVGSAPPAPAPAPEDPEDIYLRQLARIFLERYGSYSNQNNNRHIDDVLPMATAQMRAFLESKRQPFGAAYRGMTTTVVTTKIMTREPDRVTVSAGIQQAVSVGSAARVEYAGVRVELVREGGEWKVDGVFFDAP